MTTITTDPGPTTSFGSVVRLLLVALAAMLVVAAFATGRATAPTDTEIIRSVVTVPASDVDDAGHQCRLGRPC